MNFTRRQMLKTATILASTAPFKNWVEAVAYQYFLAKISGGEAILPTDLHPFRLGIF
jgi:hypothetical protein